MTWSSGTVLHYAGGKRVLQTTGFQNSHTKPKIRSREQVGIRFGGSYLFALRTTLVTQSFKPHSGGSRKHVSHKHLGASWITSQLRAEEYRRGTQKTLWIHEK